MYIACSAYRNAPIASAIMPNCMPGNAIAKGPMENMTGLSVGANFSAIISKPSAAVVGTSTLLCPNLSAIKPIAGCASIPTTWILAINSPMTIADIDWSSSRYTGRNAIIAP